MVLLASVSALSTKTMSANSARSNSSTGSDVAYTLIPRDKVSIGSELGRGGFGRVYEGIYKFQKVAVKCYDSRYFVLDGARTPSR